MVNGNITAAGMLSPQVGLDHACGPNCSSVCEQKMLCYSCDARRECEQSLNIQKKNGRYC